MGEKFDKFKQKAGLPLFVTMLIATLTAVPVTKYQVKKTGERLRDLSNRKIAEVEQHFKNRKDLYGLVMNSFYERLRRNDYSEHLVVDLLIDDWKGAFNKAGIEYSGPMPPKPGDVPASQLKLILDNYFKEYEEWILNLYRNLY